MSPQRGSSRAAQTHPPTFEYFVWLPRLLLHHRVSVRDVLPGAVLTTLGLVAMRAISSLLMVHEERAVA
jgi:uncharacterized BrkB/YihY/UPF0761 family membrane protein